MYLQTKLIRIAALTLALLGVVSPVFADVVYVTDFGTNNVYKVNTATAGGTQTLFVPSVSQPLGIAAAAGEIVVAPLNGAPLIYDTSGTKIGQFSQSLSSTFGMTTDAAGNFLVAESGGSIMKFSPNGTYLSTIASVSGFASAIGVDSSGNIFVTQAIGNTVEKLSSTGQLLATFGSGYLSTPQGLAIAPDGTVYVSSRGYGNVTEYTDAGVYEGVFVSGVTDAYGLLVNAAADVFLASSCCGGDTILQYNSSGSLLNTVNLPTGSTPVYLAADTSTTVPEPASLALLGVGITALGASRRRRAAGR